MVPGATEPAWLVDAAHDGGQLSLVLVRASDLQPFRWTIPNFRPYYLAEKESSQSFVKKLDLFTRQERTLAKVTYSRAPPKILKRWESDIDPAPSYVYDNGLRFGIIHDFQDEKWIPKAHLTTQQSDLFEKLFADIKREDPLKHSMLEDFYRYVVQPIPRVDLDKLGLADGQPSEEEYYKSFILSRVANLPISRTYRSRMVSDWIRGMLDTYYRAHNILIPNSDELKLGSTKKYVTGALTITPESGTYFNMVVLDFESLYPGVIDHYNLCYETIRCADTECQSNLVPGLDYHVCRRRRGIYSALVGALRDFRVRYYKPLTKGSSNDSQEAKVAKAAAGMLKLFLNSSFGVTIRIHGLASPLLGEAITAYGRHILQSTWDMARDGGLRPRYGDTDSVFLDNPGETGLQEFVEKVKARFRIELAYDRSYAVCVLSAAKKAYFGILPDGAPEIKGLTVAKSNSPRFFLKVFQDCLALLSEGRGSPENFEDAKRRVRGFVRDALHKLRHGQVPMEDLEYVVELREDPYSKFKAKTVPQAYQAARLLIEKGGSIPRRGSVGFVKVHPFKFRGKTFTVKPFSQASIGEVNVEDYVRNLVSSLSQTYEPMDISLGLEEVPKLSQFSG